MPSASSNSPSLEDALRARLAEDLRLLVKQPDRQRLAAELERTIATITRAMAELMLSGGMDEARARHLRAQMANVGAASASLTRQALLNTLQKVMEATLAALSKALI